MIFIMYHQVNELDNITMWNRSIDSSKELTNNSIGFLSYGSGSKSKVLEGKVVKSWKEKINHLNIFESLDCRDFIDFKTYEKLHNNSIEEVILKKN